MSQLYALLRNGQLRYIDLAEEIIESTRQIFVDAANELMNEQTEKVEFDGRYVIREDEDEILYITKDLPKEFSDIPDNQQGITLLDIDADDIKSVFWYEDETFYFQMFSSGNLLWNKYIIRYLQENRSFNRLTEKAFVINNKIQAIHKDGRLYFKSFPSASKIFDLNDNMVAATTAELLSFGNKENVSIDVGWLSERANTKTRRLIKMIIESGTLDTYMSLSNSKRKSLARSVKIDIDIENDRLILPSNVSKLNKVLEFLNEDVYKGLITSNVFRTNSKRPG